jgi:hypothetical protein
MVNTLQHIVDKFHLDLSQSQSIQISNIGRTGLASLFSELKFKTGAEVGVDRGAFSEILCQSNPELKLYSIDSWSTFSFEDPLNSSPGMQDQFDRHYKSAKRKLSKYNCTIIKKESLDAVQDFSDNSLDFVYIDSNHSFINIAQDLYRWEKKVRVGGIVAGHDYRHFTPSKDNHVKHIVDAFTQAFEISPYFELGQDRYHSWFWVK